MITRDNWKKSKSPWTFYKQTTKMYTKYKTQKTWLKRNNSQSNLSKSASHGLQNIKQPIKRKNQVTIYMEWLLSFLQLKSPTTLLKIFFNLKLSRWYIEQSFINEWQKMRDEILHESLSDEQWIMFGINITK